MDELVTLLLSDGRPGHTHLSRGICAALQRCRPLRIIEVGVRRPRWLPARVLSTLTNAEGALSQTIPRLVGVPSRIGDFGLIVSAGGDTLAASAVLAKARGCSNVFYGSLRRYKPTDFSLVLTSYAANANRPHHAMTLKPSAFDPETLPLRPRDVGVIGFLIGGDSGTVRFGPVDWQRLLALMAAIAERRQRIVISNSRRTPTDLSNALGRLAETAAPSVTFIDVRQAQSSTLVSLFAACDCIAVTVDSSSMVSEGIWARKPVVVLAPAIAVLPPLEQSYRDYLRDSGWSAELTLTDASPAALTLKFNSVTPLRSNPLDDLAALLKHRLPQLF